ncbi:hypothetical protein GCK32_003622 [Trichostrongylus colubriformis]|uniref:Cadherin domain-containing protein n=1 Tax=Trichostrongylus colubriformis TaxID=6319 RepID=A0AAN8G0U7_TRICO
MHITLNRSVSESDQTTVLTANDPDQGINGRVRYSILDSEVVAIDPDTGRLSLLKELDCSLGSEIRFKVRATDGGVPSLYSDLQVIADLVDGYGRPPQFEKSLYEVQIAEDSEIGTCLLKVKATNSLCGGSSRLRYAIQDNGEAVKVKATNSLCGGSSRLRYAIQDSGEAVKIFNIESMTGTICLERKLDYEKIVNHQLTIAAIDQNGSTGTCLVSVRVLDVNDNLPIFYPLHYNVTVREAFQSTAGNPLLVVSATDDDEGTFGEVHFFVKSGDPATYQVDEMTGELFLKKPLSRGKYDVTIFAKDGSGATSEEPAHVHIYVIDSDAMAPSFTQSSYLIKTPEDILPGISIGSVLATGPGTIRYSIYSGDLHHQFMIHPDTGRITVARYLDADKIDRVVLNVKAELVNGGSNHTQVVILIEDHNDNAPKFPVDMLEITVSENQTSHEPFYIVHATDKDKRKNGAVVYSILSSHPPCPVMVQPLTGQLQLTEPLDFEKIKDYRIRIKAQDQGIPPRSSNMTLILHVSDFNDNAPVFEHSTYNVQVLENSPLMTPVVKVKARDADSRENGKVLYRITNGSSAFGIDEKSGVIYTNESIDREARSMYTITVKAQDQGEPSLSASAVVHIHIADVNDNAPSCTSVTSLLVPFDSAPSTTVGTVVIADPDNGSNGTVVYRSQQSHPLFVVKSNAKDNGVKIVDPKGEMLATEWEAPADPFKLSPLLPIGSKVVSLAPKIKPRTGPPFYYTLKKEFWHSGTTVTTANATTSPQSASPTYQLKEPSTRFAIDQYSGEINVIDSLDWREAPYHLVVVATAGGGKASQLVVINVDDKNNNHPEIISAAEVLVFTEPSNRVIHYVVATDDDFGQNAAISYDLISDPTDCFGIDHKTGALSMLRRPPSSDSTIVVRASDQGSPSLFADQTLTIRLTNDNKKWNYFGDEEVVVTISDSAPVGTTITTLSLDGKAAIRLFPSSSAFAIDHFGKISLSSAIIAGVHRLSGSNRFFKIDPSTGKLSSPSLDREQQSEHLLVIVAQDGDINDSCTVRITVSDVNDNVPQFAASTLQVISINDSISLRDVVYKFTAFDHDLGVNGRVVFDLLEDSSMAFDLSPESGELIFVREPVNVGKDWMIRVRVYDKGIPSLGVDRLFRVQDSRTSPTQLPDAQPSFLRQKYVSSIDEGLMHGQIVSKVATSSRDARITYSIVEGNTDSAFEIDGDGVVRTSQELDFEIKERYDLKIIATGAFPSQLQTHLRIDVNNINDNPPVFPRQQKKKVLETLPVGSYVTTVTANDADNLAALEYSLDAKEERFVIDRYTGVVHLATSLDYETVEEISVEVKVTDGNYTATTSFLVVVMDVNDNAPEFQERIVDIKVSQSTNVDEVLAKLIAFDRDSGENGRVAYSLAESYGVFQLDSNDGTLTLIQPLTRQSEYLLTVTASDHGSPVLSSTIPVRITVTKEETQQRPQFLHSTYESAFLPKGKLPALSNHAVFSFVVSESLSPHIVFGNVSVGQLPYFYRIMDAKASDVFDIDQLGRLSLKAPLDREAKELYTFAIDVGSQPLSYHQNSTATITIRVSDVNDNAPLFAQSECSVTVRDGMRSGEVTLRSTPHRRRNHTVEQITVIAASSHIQQTKATVYLEIGEFPIRSANSPISSNIFKIGAVATAALFVLLICLLGCCLFGYRSSKPKEIDSPRKQIYSIGREKREQQAEDSTVIRRLASSPKQPLPSNVSQKTSSMTSSASSTSAVRNSLLSHREAASTRSQPDSGIDQDTVSVNSSVTEYLISIGVNPNPIQSRSRFRRPDTIDSALNEYIYARVEDVLPPGPVNLSENVEQLDDLYHFSHARLSAPTFQPLTEIFDELEEIQREQQGKHREYVQVEI